MRISGKAVWQSRLKTSKKMRSRMFLFVCWKTARIQTCRIIMDTRRFCTPWLNIQGMIFFLAVFLFVWKGGFLSSKKSRNCNNSYSHAAISWEWLLYLAEIVLSWAVLSHKLSWAWAWVALSWDWAEVEIELYFSLTWAELSWAEIEVSLRSSFIKLSLSWFELSWAELSWAELVLELSWT